MILSARKKAAAVANEIARGVFPLSAAPARGGLRGEGSGISGPGAWQGAWQTESRGFIFWPSTDPEREYDPLSRVEIARRAHWSCAHLGLARRIRSGLVSMIIGNGLTPKSLNRDTAWARKAEKYYNARANSPVSYDVRGRISGRKAQRLLLATRLVDGDAVAVRSKSESGAAMRSFYSGLAVGNTLGRGSENDGWRDGVKLDALGRTAAFRFPGLNGTKTDVPARNCSFLCDFEQFGQLRGMSIFAHAVAPMIDITEVDAATMRNIKTSAQIAWYLKRQLDAPGGAGMLDRMRQGQRVEVPAPGEPENASLKRQVKRVFGTGGEVADVPAGAEIQALLDQRPSPNSREFVWDYITRVCWGCGVAPELLWAITKLGGANSRLALVDAQNFVGAQQQDFVEQYLSPDWAWTIGCGLASGALEYPREDPEWWRHGWIPPERWTVDFGRDGKVMLEQYRAGLITAQRWFSMKGQDAYEETMQHLQFCAWRKERMEKLGLTMAECYPSQPGAAAVATDADSKATAEDDDPAVENAPENEDDSDLTL